MLPLIDPCYTGDREKALDLPVSPLCDRCHPGITKSQVCASVYASLCVRVLACALLCMLVLVVCASVCACVGMRACVYVLAFACHQVPGEESMAAELQSCAFAAAWTQLSLDTYIHVLNNLAAARGCPHRKHRCLRVQMRQAWNPVCLHPH